MWAGFSPVVVSAQGLCVGRHSPGSSNRHSALKNDTFMLILNAKILSVDALPTSEYPAGQLRDLAVLLSHTCSDSSGGRWMEGEPTRALVACKVE